MPTKVRVYVDDSGNNPSEPVFVLAGWVAGVEEWDRFSDDWMTALRKEPRIEYFKHYEAKSLSGQFEHWSASAAEDKMVLLAEIVRSHENYGVITGMRNDVLARLLQRSVLAPKQLRSVLHMTRPYDWCFHGTTAAVLQRQVNVQDTAIVDFVFDEGDGAFEDCASTYRKLREHLPPAMKEIAGTVTTGNDKLTLPLQAADLLAGQATTNIKRGRPEKAFKVLNRDGNRILLNPVRWPEPILTGFADLLEPLNLYWSTLVLDRAIKKAKS